MVRSRIIALGCFVAAIGVGLTLIGQQGTEEPGLASAPAAAVHHSTIGASGDCLEDVESTDVQRVSRKASAHAHEDEHAAALRLTPRCEASHVAVRSGRWSDPRTWHDRRVPVADSRILIPPSIAVHVDAVFDRAAFEWVRVDGHLSFRPDVDTAMAVRTLVV